MQARQEVCLWSGKETSCTRMFVLAIVQIVLSVTDYFIGMYLPVSYTHLTLPTKA